MRGRVLLGLVLGAFFSVGCPERRVPEQAAGPRAAQTAVGAASADETAEDDPGLDEPTMAPEPPLDLDHMSDDALETACFRGRQAACDRLGH